MRTLKIAKTMERPMTLGNSSSVRSFRIAWASSTVKFVKSSRRRIEYLHGVSIALLPRIFDTNTRYAKVPAAKMAAKRVEKQIER